MQCVRLKTKIWREIGATVAQMFLFDFGAAVAN